MLIWNELARCLCMVIWVSSLKRTRQMSLYVLVIWIASLQWTRQMSLYTFSICWMKAMSWLKMSVILWGLASHTSTFSSPPNPSHTTLVFFQLKSRSPTTNTYVQWPMVIQYKSSIENSKRHIKHSSKFSMTVKSLFFSWISINKILKKCPKKKKKNKTIKDSYQTLQRYFLSWSRW